MLSDDGTGTPSGPDSPSINSADSCSEYGAIAKERMFTQGRKPKTETAIPNCELTAILNQLSQTRYLY